MGEAIKNTGNELKERWHQKMPRFFRWLMYACALVAGTAFCVNTALITSGAQPHEWWINIYPYMVGIPVGMAFCAKFTCDGGFREKGMETLDKNTGRTILDKDDN